MEGVTLKHGDKPVDPTPAVDESKIKQGTNGEVLIDTTVSDDKPSDRPSWLPEKFKSAEDMAKSYAELEAKLSKGEKPKEEAKPTPAAEAQQAIVDAGLDLGTIAREVAKDGKISEASLKALEAKGIKKEVAESYVAGQAALADALVTEISSIAGGKDEYAKMLTWAKANVDAADIAGFDAAIQSGNTALAKLAVRGLAAQYAEAVGTEPALITGEGVPHNTGVKPYESTAQVIADMQNKKYKTDPAFRRKVEARLAVTDL